MLYFLFSLSWDFPFQINVWQKCLKVTGTDALSGEKEDIRRQDFLKQYRNWYNWRFLSCNYGKLHLPNENLLSVFYNELSYRYKIS